MTDTALLAALAAKAATTAAIPVMTKPNHVITDKIAVALKFSAPI